MSTHLSKTALNMNDKMGSWCAHEIAEIENNQFFDMSKSFTINIHLMLLPFNNHFS